MRLIDADTFKEQVAAIAIMDNLPADKCNALCELIGMQPTAGSWHKVAEGDLPNHTIRVLVYIKYKASDRIPPHCVANYAGGKWWYPSDREITGEARVIAWMELPEYEEEQP